MPDPTTVKTDSGGQPTDASKPKTMWVVSARDDDRVVLWDPDPKSQHPNGEAFIAGRVPEEVALTPEVNGKLRMGELREATAEEVQKRQKQMASSQAPAAKGPWD